MKYLALIGVGVVLAVSGPYLFGHWLGVVLFLAGSIAGAFALAAMMGNPYGR